MYMLNSFGIVAIGFVGPHRIRNNLYDFFWKVEVFSTLIYIGMGCIMVVGGRTFFESIPSNILTMILIGASLYLIGVIFFFMEEISVQPRYLAFFTTAAAVCHYVAILLAVASK
jgi:hemolysin III